MTKHTWTPDAVHELVKDWPDLARASIGWAPGERQWVQTNGDPLSADLAAAAHVASGLEWLSALGDECGYAAISTDDAGVWISVDGDDGIDGHYQTTLHAVSAAIMAAGGGK